MTVAGTPAKGLFDDRLMVTWVEVIPLRVTVPVAFCPPGTEVGAIDMPRNEAGITVINVLCVTPLPVAVIVPVTVLPSGIVETGNDAEVAPAGMVTEAGTVIPPLFDERVTTMAENAVPVRVTVPFDSCPPTTGFGFTVTLPKVAGVIVNVAVWVTPP